MNNKPIFYSFIFTFLFCCLLFLTLNGCSGCRKNQLVQQPKTAEVISMLDLATYYAQIEKDTFAFVLDDTIIASSEISSAYAEAGQQEQATEMLNQALKTAKSSQDYSYRALSALAVACMKVGQGEQADKMFNQALKIVQGTKRPWDKANALHKIAVAYAEVGDFQQALKIAQSINVYSAGLIKCYALSEIAVACMKAGQGEQADEMFSQALSIALYQSIPFNSKCSALRKISAAYAEIAQQKQAANVLNQALQEALQEAPRSYPLDPGTIAEVLCDIAVAYAEVGQQEQAGNVLNQALQEVLKHHRNLFLLDMTGVRLCSIADACAKAGDSPQAGEVLNQVLKMAQKIKLSLPKSQALKDIAVA